MLSSYQKRKQEIAYLQQRIWELAQKAEFFQKAIWDARKATGERLPVQPFTSLEGEETDMARAWVIKKGYQYYDMWSDSFGPLGNATLWENHLVAEEYRQGDPETVVEVEIREVP